MAVLKALAARLSRSSRAIAVVSLGAALTLSAIPAGAQTRGDGVGNVVKRGGGGGGHRGIGGAGIAGALIGLGAGLIIEGARARAERDREVEYVDEDERPARRPTKRPREERTVVEREVQSKRKTKPEKPATVVRATPAKTEKPQKAAQDRPRPPKPPRNTPPAATTAAPAAAAVVAAADPTIVPDEVLFEVRAGVSDQDVAALAGRERLERISAERFELTGSTIYRYRITDRRRVADVTAALEADGRVRAAQPNHVFTLSGPDLGLAATQYAAAKMRLPQAHERATGARVTVAIIDSGIDAAHPALKGAVVEAFDPVGGAFKPHAHGTAVAGLAAGRGDLASPAPGARILAIRAFAPDQPAKPGAQGTTMHILRGLDFAAARGAKIVNMSFAGPRDAKISEFIAAGAAKGAIHVAAAGNAGPSSPPLYPAADPNVIAVTATGEDDALLNVANRGAHLSVAAPGVDVLVATPGGGFGYLSGTSMSSAEIAGIVALMVETKPLLTAQEARTALEASARDLGAAGPDADFGAGLADARGALDQLTGEPAPSVEAVSAADAPPAAELAQRP